VRESLADAGLVGWPKTSGSRGIHVNVRIDRRWTFPEVRRAALALARDVEQRAPELATSKWWKEERHGVFIDYNQNAKDRTVASAYSVRPRPDARVSTPLTWDEVATIDPASLTIRTVPARYARIGDPGAGIDDAAGSLDGLLELSARHETDGLGDAPWPPNYAKTIDEPPRVQPSKRRMSSKPLIEIGRAALLADAQAGLDRWKSRHPDVWPHLQPADILTDSMRGRFTTWTRIRLNLEHVPEDLRPPQETLDPDYDPWHGATPPTRPRPEVRSDAG
jgi:bifunctional non-homologous end joining protein LigD